MWQVLATHGRQEFQSVSELEQRMRNLESALDDLCLDVARVSSDQKMSGLERARQLRAKPVDEGKSLYECLNQLIHYWYCCAAGKYLMTCGCTKLVMHPTAENSGSKGEHAFNLGAYTGDGTRVIAEVFCVSEALWQAKMRKTIKKVLEAGNEPHRVIFYNREAKLVYPTRKAGVYIFAIDVASGGGVSPICCTEPRRLIDLWPGDPVSAPKGRSRADSDEHYILDLCDEVLSQQSRRQHRFGFLVGDNGHPLPVDAYYPERNLVVEYREYQHSEPLAFFDRKMTVSGIPRGQQRALYDQRRRDILPENGITLVEFCYSEFARSGARKLKRDRHFDINVIRQKLQRK
jgi:hypothetical protein